MISKMLEDVSKVYIAYGATDFRKQISSLCAEVKCRFNFNPYKNVAFMFCNKKRTSIKVLCYDKNGFVLAQKTLLANEKMKFQWPRNSNELKNISKQQLNWLLSGLKIEQKHSFREYKLDENNTAN